MHPVSTIKDIKDMIIQFDVQINDLEHIKIDPILGDISIFSWNRTNSCHNLCAIEILDGG